MPVRTYAAMPSSSAQSPTATRAICPPSAAILSNAVSRAYELTEPAWHSCSSLANAAGSRVRAISAARFRGMGEHRWSVHRQRAGQNLEPVGGGYARRFSDLCSKRFYECVDAIAQE